MLAIREDHAVAAWPWIAETGPVGKQNDLLQSIGFHKLLLCGLGIRSAIQRPSCALPIANAERYCECQRRDCQCQQYDCESRKLRHHGARDGRWWQNGKSEETQPQVIKCCAQPDQRAGALTVDFMPGLSLLASMP